jgi:hypothetical protein
MWCGFAPFDCPTKNKNHMEKTFIKKEFTDHNIAELTIEFNTGNYDRPSNNYLEIKIENHSATMMEVNGRETDLFVLKLKGLSERKMIKEFCELIAKSL